MSIKEDYLDSLTGAGKNIWDIDVILVAGKEISWEEFNESDVYDTQEYWDIDDDIVILGKGNWYIERHEADSWNDSGCPCYFSGEIR